MEEGNTGRYFPSPHEQAILTQHIEGYFQLPERSDERSKCVQKVTEKLVELNPRWNNRAVRLWFNNNKRCLKTQQVQFDMGKAQPLPTEQLPIKKRPPRSKSAAGMPFVRPISPLADFSAGDILMQVFNVLQHAQTDDSKKDIEYDLTSRLIEIEGRSWVEHVSCIEPKYQINARRNFPGMAPDGNLLNPRFDIIEKYEGIDCATIINGIPVIVDNGEIHYTESIDLQLPMTGSCVSYDSYTRSMFVGIGNMVFPITCEGMEVGDPMVLPCGPLLRSSIDFMHDCIAVGGKSQLMLFGRNRQLGCSVDPGIGGITSVCAVGDSIAVASRNHHAIKMLDKTGQSLGVFIGHGAGVTCVTDMNDSRFMSGSCDKTVRIWDVRTPKPVTQIQKHLGTVTVIGQHLTDSKHYVITGGEDNVIRCWDLRMLQELWEVGTGNGIPIALEYQEVAGNPAGSLTVVTKEKTTTMAEGFDLVQSEDSRVLLDVCPNLSVRFEIL